MADDTAYVYADLEGEVFLVGQLWHHRKKGKESSTFKYDEHWIQYPHRFSLDPALRVGRGAWHSSGGKALFGSLGDSSPDRWGRVLMRRKARMLARENNEPERALSELDYLLMVNDSARGGALRFKKHLDGEFMAMDDENAIPPLVNLVKLLNASDQVMSDEESDDDLKLLFAPGSSLGGARPKATVRDVNKDLLIAKFPSKSDEWNVVLWEAVVLRLAEVAGVNACKWRIENVSGRQIILLKRFDRVDECRIPFVSAMSMLGARDHEQHSYLEIVDAIKMHGKSVKSDLEELWRRIVFSISISNTDDHLRNHGFLRFDAAGWSLSPAYDLNPVPVDIKSKMLSTAISLDDNTASLDLALSVSEGFGLDIRQAENIIDDVERAVSGWRKVASDFGLKSKEIDRMASAFIPVI